MEIEEKKYKDFDGKIIIDMIVPKYVFEKKDDTEFHRFMIPGNMEISDDEIFQHNYIFELKIENDIKTISSDFKKFKIIDYEKTDFTENSSMNEWCVFSNNSFFENNFLMNSDLFGGNKIDFDYKERFYCENHKEDDYPYDPYIPGQKYFHMKKSNENIRNLISQCILLNKFKNNRLKSIKVSPCFYNKTDQFHYFDTNYKNFPVKLIFNDEKNKKLLEKNKKIRESHKTIYREVLMSDFSDLKTLQISDKFSRTICTNKMISYYYVKFFENYDLFKKACGGFVPDVEYFSVYNSLKNKYRKQVFQINPYLYNRYFLIPSFLKRIDEGESIIDIYSENLGCKQNIMKKALKTNIPTYCYDYLYYFSNPSVMDKNFDIKIQIIKSFENVNEVRYEPYFKKYVQNLLCTEPIEKLWNEKHPQQIVFMDQFHDAVRSYCENFVFPFMGYENENHVDIDMAGKILAYLIPDINSMMDITRYFHENPDFNIALGKQNDSKWTLNIGQFCTLDKSLVTPLNSTSLFLQEGREMKHCVASHCYYAQKGKYTVFSIINNDKTRSTLEVDTENKCKVQHYSYCNSQISDKSQKTEKEINKIIQKIDLLPISFENESLTQNYKRKEGIPVKARNRTIAGIWRDFADLEKLNNAIEFGTDPNTKFIKKVKIKISENRESIFKW